MDIFAEALKRLQEREQKFAAVSAAELQGGGAAPMDPMAGAGGGMPPGAPMDPAMAGGMPPGAPMDPAMMDPAMMDPAAAGGMPPEEDPLVLLLDALDEITKQTKQSNVMLAAIVDAFNVKIDTKDLLEMEEPPAGKESSQQPQQVAAPTTRLVEKAATEGRPGMPSSYALASSPSAALSQMCRVAAKHFQSRG